MHLSSIFRPYQVALLLTLTLGLTAITPANAVVSSDQSKVTASADTEKQPIMLADEIIRRLRRLGLNFTKNRIPHPYDPFGELC